MELERPSQSSGTIVEMPNGVTVWSLPDSTTYRIDGLVFTDEDALNTYLKDRESTNRNFATKTCGVGSELKNLLAELGFSDSIGCGCNRTVRWMNAIGPGECREKIQKIVSKLRRSRKLVSWFELAKAGFTAWKSELPLTPEGLVMEAICRAEDQGIASSS